VTGAYPVLQADSFVSADPVRPARPWARTFPGVAASVPEARRFVTGVLVGCPAREVLVTCVSELSTNAIVHTASGNGGVFTVEVDLPRDGTARVAVTDAGGPSLPAAAPLRRAAAPLDPSSLDSSSLDPSSLDSSSLDSSSLDSSSLDSSSLDSSSLDSSSLDSSSLEASCLDPSCLDPSCLDPSSLDSAARLDRTAPVQLMAEGGRGLALVAACTSRWGYADAHPGRTVWAEACWPVPVPSPGQDVPRQATRQARRRFPRLPRSSQRRRRFAPGPSGDKPSGPAA
jgi:hypothetical protein